jgi:hypothetical protein
VGDEFGTTLGATVRIMTAEVVGFPVTPFPLLVSVSLIASYEHGYLDPGPFPNTFEQVDHSHGVGLEGLNGIDMRL